MPKGSEPLLSGRIPRPAPLKGTRAGLEFGPDEIVTSPRRIPAWVGVKVMATAHDEPGLRMVGQLETSEKSPVRVTLKAMLALPELLMAIVWAEAETPVTTTGSLKVSDKGITLRSGFATLPVEFAGATVDPVT